MSSTPKEGGTRPLTTGAPILPAQPAAQAPAQGSSSSSAAPASTQEGPVPPTSQAFTAEPPTPSTTPSPAPAPGAAAPPAAPAAPVYATPVPPKAEPAPLPTAFCWAALFSYLPAYVYARGILLAGGGAAYTTGMLVFALLFLPGVELFARALHRPGSRETPFWAACWLLLSLFLRLYGSQGGGLAVWQFLAWHLLAIWYVLARCGMLAAGASGSLIWLDALAGLFRLPWPGMLLRLRALWQGLRGLLHARAARLGTDKKRLAAVAASVLLAIAVGAVAWGQLAAADAHFARLGSGLSAWLHRFALPIDAEGIACLLLSLPVGAWLYGLVGGSLRRSGPPTAAEGFFAALAPRQKLPAFTVYLTLGALCGIYALFFAVQAHTFATTAFGAGRLALSGPQASRFAVDGFWELCRVLLLNFALLAGIRFLGPQLRQQRAVRALCTAFCVFGLGFVALAAAKLGAYIHLYAFTPRRVISGWFLCVLAVWAVLALLWVLGVRVPFGHARLGVYAFAAAFLVLSAVDMDRCIVRANISRWAAGQDAALDTASLRACDVGDGWYGDNAHQTLYAGWLLDAGWFTGRSADEIGELYYGISRGIYEQDQTAQTATGVYSVPLDGSTLRLTLEQGICAAAELVPGTAPAAGAR